MKYKLGLIGAGNMAEAVAKAAIEQGLVTADKIIASDTNPERRDLFASLGINVTEDNDLIVTEARQIMLAVKPQVFPDVAGLLGKVDAQRQIIISIMAGITTAKIEELAGQPLRVIRVMPNTPMMVMQGMAGVACGESCQPGDDAFAMQLFGAAGKAVSVSESDIDAITAISGSGPAYIFYLAEAMEESGGHQPRGKPTLRATNLSRCARSSGHAAVRPGHPRQQARHAPLGPGTRPHKAHNIALSADRRSSRTLIQCSLPRSSRGH